MQWIVVALLLAIAFAGCLDTAGSEQSHDTDDTSSNGTGSGPGESDRGNETEPDPSGNESSEPADDDAVEDEESDGEEPRTAYYVRTEVWEGEVSGVGHSAGYCGGGAASFRKSLPSPTTWLKIQFELEVVEDSHGLGTNVFGTQGKPEPGPTMRVLTSNPYRTVAETHLPMTMDAGDKFELEVKNTDPPVSESIRFSVDPASPSISNSCAGASHTDLEFKVTATFYS